MHNISKELRTNDRIKAREVRLIDDQGGQLGVLRFEDALELAQSKNLDLVEVAPNSNPPVCKLLDFGRYKYEQTKREREARKGAKQLVLKEIWFRPHVDEHDRQFKTRQILRFLEEGDKVKVTVRFRGRELAHPELARTVLQHVSEELEGSATVEKTPLMEGRAMTMIVAPGKALQKQIATGGPAKPAPPANGETPAEQTVTQPVRSPAPVA